MKDLREMTAKELKEIAKGMKISNWWNLKKEVLIEKIEAAQNMTDEEKQAIEEERAREDAAIAEYTKDWKKYTKRYNVSEFLMKWKSGEIVLESEKTEETELEETEVQEETPVEEQPIEEKPVTDPQPKENDSLNTAVKTNLKNAYNWIVGGYENSVMDGEMTQEEFDQWIKNEALAHVYSEAISSAYGEDYAGGEPPKGMKSADKKACLEYLMKWFIKEGYEVEMPEIKAGHAPTPKRGALIEWNGKSQNICAWGKELGISPNTLYGRLYKMNWSVEKAFTTKKQ